MTAIREQYRDSVCWVRRGPWLCIGLLALMIVNGFGCASIRITDPERTATEQFLLSGAASRAVGQLTFGPLRGRSVYVDTRYFAASEEEFVLGELRARLFVAGVNLVPTRDEAEIVMEVRSGGVGIDRSDFLVGLPSVAINAEGDSGTFGIPFILPEVALLKNTEQWGIASVAYVAYWNDTGEVVASSGPYVGWSNRDDWWILGYGPQTVGNIPPIGTPDPEALQRNPSSNSEPPPPLEVEVDESPLSNGDAGDPNQVYDRDEKDNGEWDG